MVIPDDMRQRIFEEMAQYPEKRGALLPALRRVQAQHGFISTDAAREVAALFEIGPVEVLEVVHFYNLFWTEPRGRHQVNVCTNLSCSLRGARTLLRRLAVHLAVEVGTTTDDGRITLGHEECLGACDGAPVLRIDDDYHEDLDFEGAVGLLEALE